MAIPQPLSMFDDEGNQIQVSEDDHVDSGAIIAWDKVDGTGSGNIQMMGIRTVILCLVMCMGRLVTDGASCCLKVKRCAANWTDLM